MKMPNLFIRIRVDRRKFEDKKKREYMVLEEVLSTLLKVLVGSRRLFHGVIILVMVSCVLGGLFLSPITGEGQSFGSTRQSHILIDGNADFLAQAAMYNWTGTGTSTDPLILTNVNGTLEIRNTDLMFQVRDNTQRDDFDSVILVNVSQGLIMNNDIVHTQIGILLENCFNMTISQNIFQENSQEAIKVVSSTYNVISDNNFWANKHYGVYLDHLTNYTLVTRNDFRLNHQNSSQAFDNGSQNWFLFNYWSDWTSPDSNNDSIVDYPYLIPGAGENRDPWPRKNPYDQTEIQTQTAVTQMGPTPSDTSTTFEKTSLNAIIPVIAFSVLVTIQGFFRYRYRSKKQ